MLLRCAKYTTAEKRFGIHPVAAWGICTPQFGMTLATGFVIISVSESACGRRVINQKIVFHDLYPKNIHHARIFKVSYF